MIEPDVFLINLGSTSNEVAKTLKTMGIKGIRRQGTYCPIFNALQKCGFDVIHVQPTYIFMEDGQVYPVPETVLDFINEFDCYDMYPELEQDCSA